MELWMRTWPSVSISNETRTYQQKLEHLQQRILAVAPALTPEKRLLVHFYTLNHVHNGKHCGLRVTFLEKCAYL